MTISRSDWLRFAQRMGEIDTRAGDLMRKWIETNGTENRDALIEYANALVQKYGEASGELACQMYEAIAEAQGATIPPAEPADLPSYGEVAKAVNGSLKQGAAVVPQAVSRQVKQVGADTTLKNAERDGAQFAWIPSGDTCAFCLTLASRGWQNMSKSALKVGHAEHIHANCNCQYAIRFDKTSSVQGYDPDKYLEMYENAKGSSSKEKINSMRRNFSAKEKGITNKRIRKESEYQIDRNMIDSNEYKRKFNNITSNSIINESIYKRAKGALYHRDGTNREDLYILSSSDGRILGKNTMCNDEFGVSPNKDVMKAVKGNYGRIIGLHTHPNDTPPTGSDFSVAFARKYEFGVMVDTKGNVYKYGPGEKFISARHIDKTIENYIEKLDDVGNKKYDSYIKAHIAALNQLRKDGVIWYETW